MTNKSDWDLEKEKSKRKEDSTLLFFGILFSIILYAVGVVVDHHRPHQSGVVEDCRK